MNETELAEAYLAAALAAALAQRSAGSLFAVAYLDPERRSDVAVLSGPSIPSVLLEVPDRVVLEGAYLVAAPTGRGEWRCLRHQNLDWFWPEALQGLAEYAGHKVEAELVASMSRHPAGKGAPA